MSDERTGSQCQQPAVPQPSGNGPCPANPGLPAMNPARELAPGQTRGWEILRAPQSWERTFDALPDMIAIIDTEHRVVRANRAMAQRLGRTVSQVEGSHCFELMHGLNNPPDFCPHARLLEDGQEHTVEIEDPRLGGFFNVTASPITDEQGGLLGSVHVVRDITNRKRLQAQLMQAQKMEAVGTLAGGVAHDFNNILAAIMGYTELSLAQAPLEAPLRYNLEQILKAAERGRKLVKQILTFSHQGVAEHRAISLNQLILRTIELLERTLPKMIDIQVDLGDGLWEVMGDSNQLELVLMNLASNAKDAMPEGGVLRVSTENRQAQEILCSACGSSFSGPYVLLRVEDTGQGMDQETLSQIFNPFFTTKDVGKGTGLGLSMVFGIVKDHGGHLVCRSRPGRGTRFDIYLPSHQPILRISPQE